jgi:hypothetical protein
MKVSCVSQTRLESCWHLFFVRLDPFVSKHLTAPHVQSDNACRGSIPPALRLGGGTAA